MRGRRRLVRAVPVIPLTYRPAMRAGVPQAEPRLPL